MTTDSAMLGSTACTPNVEHAMRVEVAATAAVTLKALADPLRLRMLSFITTDPRGESCVCDLLALGDVSQPTVSHHLKVLKDAGLLDSERRGTWVWYRIVPSRKNAVTALLDSITIVNATTNATAMPRDAAGDEEDRPGVLRATGNAVKVEAKQ